MHLDVAKYDEALHCGKFEAGPSKERKRQSNSQV
jgi:hypothetical protein